MTVTRTLPSGLETQLRAAVRDVRRDEPLARHVQFRIGGPADLLVVPRSLEELEAAARVLFAVGVVPVVLGQGSNVLIGDRGIRGVVLKLGKGVDRVRIRDTVVEAEAGAGLPALALQTAKRGLAGLEFAAGIPGSVGGGVVMNAGAHGHAMDEIVEHVDLVTPTGAQRLDRAALGFRYRTSVLQGEPWIVTRVTMRLRPEAPATVKARLNAWLAHRGATQPIGPPSSGCVFRNPPGDHAGRLIDQAGGKGLAVGDARVSTLHANYIINEGQARAADVLALAEQVRQRVREHAGVTLEMEVKLLGEF
ncbi:MAG: UDP-N-acetylmuramate dehydrogenase [Armatimonadota bacterium]|nr:UDP-N-acetylmuramate dehydrogenase [Armatimonadota bacterium]